MNEHFTSNSGPEKMRLAFAVRKLLLILPIVLIATSPTAADDRCAKLLKGLLCPPPSAATEAALDLSAHGANCVDLRSQLGTANLEKLKSAPSSHLVLVDQAALNNPATRNALVSSGKHLCFSTPDNVVAVQALLAAKIKQPKFFALLPVEPQEIRAVWDLPADQDVSLITRQMSKARPEWEKVSNVTILGGNTQHADSMADVLRKAIPQREEGSNLVVIFGHNEDGILRCPDGSTISVNEIQRLAEKRQSTAIVLTCDTVQAASHVPGVLTTKRLQFDETAQVLQKAQAQLAAQPHASMGQFLNEIEGAFVTSATETKEAAQRAVKLCIGASGTILTVVVLVITSGDEEENTPPAESPGASL